MLKTTLVLVIEHSKPMPELTDIAAGRIYTLDGVEDVTAELQPEWAVAEQARPLTDSELQHREALYCLDSVMRAASHVLVGLPPSEKEEKLRSVLSKAHDWVTGERAALASQSTPGAA